MTEEQFADRPPFFQQFTKVQLEAQYAKNAETLRRMLRKAETTGRLQGGYCAKELREHLARYEQLAKAGE